MKCDVCEKSDTYIKLHEHVYLIKGKEIKFVANRRFCKNCNSLVYDAQLDNKASELAISLYNQKYGINKDDVIKLRKQYNLSQELFSKIIGCAKKTLISYEKGKSIPNDSYLIILKSLIAKPETIVTLIEANKDQFTEKEIDKINNNVDVYSNNLKSLNTAFESSPSEFNGYSKFSKEKIYNVILYLADNKVLKTKLLKEMFYADFLHYKKTGQSITGLEYSKLPLGPVPDNFEEILKQGTKEKIIDYTTELKNDYEYNNISAKQKFNNKIFTLEEIEILKQVKNKFLSFGSKDIVNFSHQEKAFTKTKFYNKISYDFAFDIADL